MRNWIKTLLLFSAFSPALLTLSYVRHEEEGLSYYVISLLAAGLAGLLSIFCIMKAINKYSEKISFTAKKIKPNDHLLIGFIFSYLIPIIARSAQLDAPKTTLLTLVVLFSLWLVSSVPAHPILSLFGYRFYEIEAAHGFVYTVISRKEIQRPEDVREVRKISSSFLIVMD
ncbi:hypothetical protein EI613_32665 (plasmid) [Azospirillum sp. 412522]|nr:hypothetical protein [Azospirillum sp. 412522]MBY6266598.1 hypothetical protein [Azospirillum sp. 412522]